MDTEGEYEFLANLSEAGGQGPLIATSEQDGAGGGPGNPPANPPATSGSDGAPAPAAPTDGAAAVSAANGSGVVATQDRRGGRKKTPPNPPCEST